jgi:hypothetical protein
MSVRHPVVKWMGATLDGLRFVEQTETEVPNPEPKRAFEQPAPVQVEEPAQKFTQVEPKTKLPPLITDDRRLLTSNEAEANRRRSRGS